MVRKKVKKNEEKLNTINHLKLKEKGKIRPSKELKRKKGRKKIDKTLKYKKVKKSGEKKKDLQSNPRG